MQDFTREDISAYVHDKINTDVKFQGASVKDPRWLDLPQTIVDRAEGIWIWVYFVVRELLQDNRDNETFKQLQKPIDSYPIELGAFFDVIVGRIDRVVTHEIRGSTDAVVNRGYPAALRAGPRGA